MIILWIYRHVKYFLTRVRQKICEHRFIHKTKPYKEYGVKVLTSCTCEKCGRSFYLDVTIPYEYLEEGKHWNTNTVSDIYKQRKI